MNKTSKDLTIPCHCDAYDFPHRFGGGACCGYSLVENFYETRNSLDDCSTCHYNTDGHCEVVEGTERTTLCEKLIDLIRSNEW